MTKTRIWAFALTLAMVASVVVAAPVQRSERGPSLEQKEERVREMREAKKQRKAREMRRFKRWLARQGETSANKVGDEYVDAIVVFKRWPKRLDAKNMNRARAFTKERKLSRFPVREVRIRKDRIHRLRQMPNVREVVVDRPLMMMSLASREAANEPGYGSINDGFSGAGVTVAVVDSGVAAHEDLPADMLQFDFTGGAYPQPVIVNGQLAAGSTSDPLYDGWGHGTHVAGIIAGDGNGSSGSFRGVAPDARIISLRVLDDLGAGMTSDLIAALDWTLAYKDALGIDVVNMSLGKGVDESVVSDPLALAAQTLWESGVVVIAAAGNYGHSGNYTVLSPGNSPHVITVGSVTDAGTGTDMSDDFVSSFSSRGPTGIDTYMKPDLLAPGNKVVAAIPGSSGLRTLLSSRVVNCSGDCSDDYLQMSGTSMATPMVAGAVARMLEKDSSLSPDTVKARLMSSAYKIVGDPVDVGAGVLDIDAAMYATGTATSALSPKMIIDTVNGSISIQDPAAVWGGSMTWNASDLYAAGYLWGDDVGASGYLWADGDLTASGYLWGDDVGASGYLWGDDGDDVGGASFLQQQPDGSFVLLDD